MAEAKPKPGDVNPGAERIIELLEKMDVPPEVVEARRREAREASGLDVPPEVDAHRRLHEEGEAAHTARKKEERIDDLLGSFDLGRTALEHRRKKGEGG